MFSSCKSWPFCIWNKLSHQRKSYVSSSPPPPPRFGRHSGHFRASVIRNAVPQMHGVFPNRRHLVVIFPVYHRFARLFMTCYSHYCSKTIIKWLMSGQTQNIHINKFKLMLVSIRSAISIDNLLFWLIARII